MPAQVSGNPFPVVLTDSGVTIDMQTDRRYLSVRTKEALRMFDAIAIRNGDIAANELGLFSRIQIGNDLKARFGSLGTPKHLFSNRKSGCAWNPKGSMRLNITELDTCPIEYQGEQCPDALWNNCMEMMFGPGNAVRDILGTPELQQLFAMFLRQQFIGLGNSFFEYAHFANHPMITTANSLGFYLENTPADEWADFYDQMTSTNCGGIVTVIDELSAEGVRGFDLDIPDTDLDTNGNFTGDVIALFERLVAASRGPLRVMVENGFVGADGRRRYPILLVTSNVYRAYENYIMTQFSTLPQAYRYQLTRTDGEILTMPNVLDWKGLPVMKWEASAQFDEIVGSQYTRAALVTPGNFGIAYDVPDLRQYSGMGMRIVQKLDAPDNGKVFMDTTLRVGTGIADPELMTYAHNAQHPI